ncbi:hypothetical protein RIF29_27481 [Crotalaria pallida]|uniref:Uncharacterized protein n=1 Tax=Crotalaria pallida TaxID=3830 RepID=A0AAN9I5M1_CROPI
MTSLSFLFASDERKVEDDLLGRSINNFTVQIFDDLDLPFAKLRLLPKGGHGGHKWEMTLFVGLLNHGVLLVGYVAKGFSSLSTTIGLS